MKQTITMRYRGEALRDHLIDINDLAPSLLALNDLIQTANRELNGGNIKIDLKIQALQPGSFVAVIVANQSFVEQTVDFFSGNQGQALTNLLTVLGIIGTTATAGIGGVIGLVKILKGRKVDELRDLGNDKVEFKDGGQTYQIEKSIVNIYNHPDIRRPLGQIVKPLAKDDIDAVEFTADKQPAPVEIAKTDAGYFQVPDAGQALDTLSDSTRETFVSVVHLWLDGEGKKWKFREGGEGAWSAVINDNDFLKKILNGEISISARDYMKVRVREVQFSSLNGLKSEYEILKVTEYHAANKQMRLL